MNTAERLVIYCEKPGCGLRVDEHDAGMHEPVGPAPKAKARSRCHAIEVMAGRQRLDEEP
jgi:hypothetical protein